MDFAEDFGSVLGRTAQEAGVNLKEGAATVAAYAAQRATHLATIVGQPGFERAVAAERDAVALFAGVVGVAGARAADARIVGLIEGALLFGAKAIALSA